MARHSRLASRRILTILAAAAILSLIAYFVSWFTYLANVLVDENLFAIMFNNSADPYARIRAFYFVFEMSAYMFIIFYAGYTLNALIRQNGNVPHLFLKLSLITIGFFMVQQVSWLFLPYWNAFTMQSIYEITAFALIGFGLSFMLSSKTDEPTHS